MIDEKSKSICGYVDNRVLVLLCNNILLYYDLLCGNNYAVKIPSQYIKVRNKGSNIVMINQRIIVASEISPCVLVINSSDGRIRKEIVYSDEKNIKKDERFSMLTTEDELYIVQEREGKIFKISVCRDEIIQIDVKEVICNDLHVNTDSFVKIRAYENTFCEHGIFVVINASLKEYLVELERFSLRPTYIYDITLDGGKYSMVFMDNALVLRNGSYICKYDYKQKKITDQWLINTNNKEYLQLCYYDGEIGIINKNGNCGTINIKNNVIKWFERKCDNLIYASGYDKCGLIPCIAGNKLLLKRIDDGIQIVVDEKMKTMLELFISTI